MNTKIAKPKKPYKDFPLFPHATGRWAKKFRGKFHYFGPWNNPDDALKKYLAQRDDLQAGRAPRSSSDGFNVRDMVNRFLTAKQHLVDTNELTQRTFKDDYSTCELLVTHLGNGQEQMERSSRQGECGPLRGSLLLTAPCRLGVPAVVVGSFLNQ